MTEEELRRTYAALVDQRTGSSSPVEVPLERLLAVFERRGSDEERLETIDRVLADPDLRREFLFLLEIARHEPSRRRTPGTGSLALAAALAVLAAGVALWPRLGPTDRPDRFRGPGNDFLLAPAPGPSPRTTPFLWHSTGAGVTYHFMLLTEGGERVFDAETSDTTLTLPGSLDLSAGAHRWWVEAEAPDGSFRRAPSRPVIFPVD